MRHAPNFYEIDPRSHGIVFFSDLKAVSDAKGATVYKDHLPLLGESIRSGGSLAGTSSLVVGDQVLGEHSFMLSLRSLLF